MIPTVRVAHPLDSKVFMTINAADYREGVHGPLWPEQAPDFRGLPEVRKPKDGDPAVRDLAAHIMSQILDHRELRAGRTLFSNLPPKEQYAMLQAARNDVEQDIRQHQRLSQVSDAEALARDAAEAATEAAEKLHQATEQAPDPAPPTDTGDRAEEADKAEEPAPAPATVDKPSWAAKPAPAPTSDTSEALSVSKGPGNKWYVLKGTTPVTEGYSTKAEAETAKSKIPQA